jgi:hypothetical protein
MVGGQYCACRCRRSLEMCMTITVVQTAPQFCFLIWFSLLFGAVVFFFILAVML